MRSHTKLRKTCKHCKTDNVDWHRFHGRGAFCRTHYSSGSKWCSPDRGLGKEEYARRKHNDLRPREWMTKRVFRKLWNNLNPKQQHNYITKKYHPGD